MRKLILKNQMPDNLSFVQHLEFSVQVPVMVKVREYQIYKIATGPDWIDVFWNKWKSSTTELEFARLTKVANDYVLSNIEPDLK